MLRKRIPLLTTLPQWLLYIIGQPGEERKMWDYQYDEHGFPNERKAITPLINLNTSVFS